MIDLGLTTGIDLGFFQLRWYSLAYLAGGTLLAPDLWADPLGPLGQNWSITGFSPDGLRASGCEFQYLPGEGAFYGPKIEYTLKDAIGREWQCGTIQVDFNLSERLDAEYVAEDGSRQRPVILHRAIVGSMERFIGILVEQHAGALPTWLAPIQVSVLNITDAQSDYCREIAAKLQKSVSNQGLRVDLDLRNEKITYKIREHSLQKLPYILVAGDKEKAAGTVAVRARGNKDLGVMSIDAFIELIAADIASKA